MDYQGFKIGDKVKFTYTYPLSAYRRFICGYDEKTGKDILGTELHSSEQSLIDWHDQSILDIKKGSHIFNSQKEELIEEQIKLKEEYINRISNRIGYVTGWVKRIMSDYKYWSGTASYAGDDNASSGATGKYEMCLLVKQKPHEKEVLVRICEVEKVEED